MGVGGEPRHAEIVPSYAEKPASKHCPSAPPWFSPPGCPTRAHTSCLTAVLQPFDSSFAFHMGSSPGRHLQNLSVPEAHLLYPSETSAPSGSIWVDSPSSPKNRWCSYPFHPKVLTFEASHHHPAQHLLSFFVNINFFKSVSTFKTLSSSSPESLGH